MFSSKKSWSPERHPEWTVSKGWVHSDCYERLSRRSSNSVSTADIDELLSLGSRAKGDDEEDLDEIFRDYRESFPEKPPRSASPTLYDKGRLPRDVSASRSIWSYLRPKTKAPRKGGASEGAPAGSTNLHEEPIYEGSEHSRTAYVNPAYAPAPLARRLVPWTVRSPSKLRREKYVIRHVRVRIMLSLRLGRVQKVKGAKKVGRRRSEKSEDEVKLRVAQAHDEQRRIGNGRTSIKIQNMRYGRLNVLRWLLWEAESREEMPALEKSSNTTLALHYAAARGCLDCVRLLVDSTPDLSANTQMDNDVTPVYLAAQEGHLEVLKFLVLEAGGSLYVRAKDGMAPVHAASQMGCLNCVKWMIQEQGVDPNLRDGDGATPLHFAASRGHLDTVRWLLKHGARLSLDKYGKSPINDAAENQQVECLNVLVQHGTTPDYQSTAERIGVGSRSCSCVRKGEKVKRGNSVGSDCSMCKPKLSANVDSFYLHPPLNDRTLEAPHAPENGLYINPMSKHRHSASSCSESSSSSVNGESFYLHNPQEVIYNRVKDLFGVNNATNNGTNEGQPLSALTVKVEVHSSSSGAGSDENLSSSDLSERSGVGGEHENDYEDIYLVRDGNAGQEEPVRQQPQQQQPQQQQRSGSRDSGSHSRSGSVSSSNSGCEVVVKKEPKYESLKKLDNEAAKPPEGREKQKLAARHSSPPMPDPSAQASRRTEPSPPPPPPPPPKAPHQRFPGRDDDEPRGAEVVEIVEEPTLRPSDVVKGMCRSMSALSARRLNSSCSDLTIVSLETEELERYAGPNLVNKQRVLPFVPPSFPTADSNNLIKPSEYLRSISDKRGATSRSESEPDEAVPRGQDKGADVPGPPPPPLPDTPDMVESSPSQEAKKQSQPLSAISIQDLNSVQLRRTEKVIASKTFSAPTRSMSLQCLQSEPFLAQKTDLIAELKMSRGDISGIKKMKVERAKTEESREKEIIMEISKQITTTKFVEKVPEKDNTGNIIPAWKRQMLAKKAADKAKKELEEQLLKEAEEKRLQAIPQWKRQLLQKKEEAENKMRSTLYTPKVVDENKVNRVALDNQKDDVKKDEVDNNNNDDSIKFEQSNDTEQSDEEPPNIIPWRAHLRKTNSKLNLLD